MLEASESLQRRGITVRSFHLGGGGPLLNAMREVGVTSRVVTPFGLASHMHARSNDIYLAFGVRATMSLRALSPVLRGRHQLWHAQVGLDPYHPRWVKLAYKSTAGLMTGAIANSAAAAEVCLGAGFAPTDVFVARSALGSQWQQVVPRNPMPRTPTAAMIGNDRPEKGHVEGVEIFSHIDGDARLRVFTNRSNTVESAARAYNISDRVTVTQGASVTPETFAEIDALLLPSRSESMPRVVLEALSQGVPVAAYNVGSVGRYVEGCPEVGDKRGLTEQLAVLLASPRRQKPRYPRTVEQYVDELLCIVARRAGKR